MIVHIQPVEQSTLMGQHYACSLMPLSELPGARIVSRGIMTSFKLFSHRQTGHLTGPSGVRQEMPLGKGSPTNARLTGMVKSTETEARS